MDQKTVDFLILNTLKNLTPAQANLLLKEFVSPTQIFSLKARDLIEKGVVEELAVQIVSAKEKVNIDKEIKEIEKNQINILTLHHSNYPQNLKNIYDPPLVLYIKGKIESFDSLSLAVVGTRNFTIYGKKVTLDLCAKLAQLKITVVSGMARGIDTFAHQSVLENKGITIAVLGSGLNICYPPENRNLIEKISENGCVISEFPLWTPPDKINFPRRNRIISGLSAAVIVIEAGKRSGALITAEYALNQGREVFAIPGDIYRQQSQGTNQLIKEGAKLVEKIEDILEEINFSFGQQFLFAQSENENLLEIEEKRIYNLIAQEPKSIEEISQQSSVPFQQLITTLTSLQIKGYILELPGKRYVKNEI